MSRHAELYDKFLDMMKRQVPVTILSGTVKAVDSEEKTCTVTLPDGLDMPGVRLKAGATKSKEYFVIIPRLKSYVLIALVGGNPTAGEYCVIHVDEWDLIDIKVDKTQVAVTKNAVTLIKDKAQVILSASDIIMRYGPDGQQSKVTINTQKVIIEPFGTLEVKNATVSLKSAITQLIDTVSNAVIVTPTGAGSIDPGTKTLLATAKANFINLLS